VRNLHPSGTVFLNVTSRTLLASSLTVLAMGGAGCVVNMDHEGQIEHVEKRFTVQPGSPSEVHLITFDGAVEVRSWDRPEVLIQIDKRGADKETLGKIEIIADKKGDVIQIEARYTKTRTTFVGLGFFLSPTAKLVASVPRNTNLTIRTSDGNVVLERVSGHADIHTGDGTVRVTETSGELLAETSDGSIQMDDVTGRIEARTSDGTIRLSGTPSSLKARSGDGSISLRIRSGASMTDDWMVTTDDGSISVELPEGFAAQIEADPGSDGRVRNELSLADVVGGTRDKRTLSGALGKGGRKFSIRTSDGTIRLINY
jgi:hypothetical protein